MTVYARVLHLIFELSLPFGLSLLFVFLLDLLPLGWHHLFSPWIVRWVNLRLLVVFVLSVHVVLIFVQFALSLLLLFLCPSQDFVHGYVWHTRKSWVLVSKFLASHLGRESFKLLLTLFLINFDVFRHSGSFPLHSLFGKGLFLLFFVALTWLEFSLHPYRPLALLWLLILAWLESSLHSGYFTTWFMLFFVQFLWIGFLWNWRRVCEVHFFDWLVVLWALLALFFEINWLRVFRIVFWAIFFRWLT